MYNHFPHYHQLDEVDCGSTSLRIIAKFYGREYPADMLRRLCHITRNGVSMLGISEAAEQIGFKTLGVKITFEQLAQRATLPCILHWNQNHFVVCYKIKSIDKGDFRIYISDPASGLLQYTKVEFLNCWISSSSHGQEIGVALLLVPGVDFNTVKKKNHGTRNLTSFYQYLVPYKKQIGLLLLGMTTGSMLQLILPFLTQAMVDLGVNAKNLRMITLILIAQLCIFIAQLCLGFIRSWLLLHINARVDMALISDFLGKLMDMPLRFFDSKRVGDIMQRIDDHARIKSFMMGNSINMLFSTVNFFIFSVVLAYYDMMILTIFLVGNFCYILWVRFFMKYRRALDAKRFSQSSIERSKILQIIQGMQDIKLNNCERPKRWEWERVQVKMFNISIKGMTVGQMQQVGSLFFSQTTNIFISFLAAKYVVEGNITLGMMMSLSYIIGQITAPVNELVNFIQVFQDAKMSLERFGEIYFQEDEKEKMEMQLVEFPKKQSIFIKHVFFSYSGAERNYVLNDINLVIPAKKVTAIVGESGSGKTTLLKLLLGFYLPNEGSILIDETPLSEINPHKWRSCVGAVMQESFIFSDTIANNIAMEEADIDVDRLFQAATLACVDSFVASMPLGYDTVIGMEGNGLSQGQRQRILLARAIYKNPDFIFLDEATNALDTSNEAAIMKNLALFYQGKTVVIAAHRLSTVKNADQIIVMKEGKIVELGSHLELIKRNGYYFQLVKDQLELNH